MIDDSKKYKIQPEANPYPHMGALLRQHIREKKVTHASLSRRIGIANTGLSRYLRQPSLQAGILWKIGLAISHNFFAELGHAFPVPDEAQAAAQQAADALIKAQLDEKDQRIADLEKELAIYKSIVMSGKGA